MEYGDRTEKPPDMYPPPGHLPHTVALKYNFCAPHPFFCSPHPFFCSPHPFFCSPDPFFCSPHHLFSSPHPFFCSLHPSTNCHSNVLGDTERRVFEWLIEET